MTRSPVAFKLDGGIVTRAWPTIDRTSMRTRGSGSASVLWSKGLNEDELRAPVNDHWTVAAVLGHIAFWDARVLALAAKMERGAPFAPSDAEPEDVDWINDACVR